MGFLLVVMLFADGFLFVKKPEWLPYTLAITLVLFFIWIIRGHHTSLRRIDKMSGEDFEELLAKYYRRRGYDVTMTRKTSDYGADLILTKGRGTKAIIVQAKRYSGHVGVSAVQQCLAAARYYENKNGYSKVTCYIVTNSEFTRQAKELAERADAKLFDRDWIKKHL